MGNVDLSKIARLVQSGKLLRDSADSDGLRGLLDQRVAMPGAKPRTIKRPLDGLSNKLTYHFGKFDAKLNVRFVKFDDLFRRV